VKEAVAACFDSQRALYDEPAAAAPVSSILREMDAASYALDAAVNNLAAGRAEGGFGDADYVICRVRGRLELDVVREEDLVHHDLGVHCSCIA